MPGLPRVMDLHSRCAAQMKRLGLHYKEPNGVRRDE
jgi:hypothetical protein